ncbi:MAG TPA: hypothetical protein VF177_04295 [Anaerolineae bacterium]
MSDDFIFRGSVEELDPELDRLLELEDQRQEATIILIASESESPQAVREAMGSTFGNIYAEGYPREESRQQSQAEISTWKWSWPTTGATATRAITRAWNTPTF